MISIYKLYYGNSIYIGQTCEKLNLRFNKHKHDALHNKKTDKKTKWFKNLLDNNVMPNIALIEQTDNQDLADFLESYYISYYTDPNNFNRTIECLNVATGGKNNFEVKSRKKPDKHVSTDHKKEVNRIWREKNRLLTNIKKKEWREKTGKP